jgi:hypothetical protein
LSAKVIFRRHANANDIRLATHFEYMPPFGNSVSVKYVLLGGGSFTKSRWCHKQTVS